LHVSHPHRHRMSYKAPPALEDAALRYGRVL
jgi:hypothetical protein